MLRTGSVVIIALALCGASADAKAPTLSEMESLYFDLDNICRGESGEASDKACEARSKTSAMIKNMGYCISYPAYTWHRC